MYSIACKTTKPPPAGDWTFDGWRTRLVDPPKGIPCAFPFVYKGKTFNSCTYFKSYNTNNKPWCATKVRNKKGVNNDWDRSKAKTAGPGIKGKYNIGICDDGVDSKCTIPPKRNFKLYHYRFL